MQLNELIDGMKAQHYNMKNVDISSIEFDSRKITPGSLYIALKGANHDGHDYIQDVEKEGAVAVITQKKVDTELPQIVVQDTRAILGNVGKRFYGDFSDMLKVAITGTNGKTTTAFLIHSILSHAGMAPGLIGTVYYLGKTGAKAGRTTPEILDILRLFSKFRDEDIDSVVLEVSSHALKYKRVEALDFDVAVFTNLSQDHLDFHETMEDYKRTKLHLFSLLKPAGWAVFNNDDAVSLEIKALGLDHAISFGTTEDSDLWAELKCDSLDGLKLEIHYGAELYCIASPLIGAFNLYNIVAAVASGIALGIERQNIIRGIEALNAVRGRMERVVDKVFVDFAHTPAAIENVLKSARKYTQGRLVLVFGCGGDRDREKRAQMGAIATELADLAVITSDNPRSEPPLQIIEEIRKGVVKDNYKVIADRREAIEYAVSLKQGEDIVIVAGKGHEEYQLVNDKVIEFNDAEVVRRCFANSQ